MVCTQGVGTEAKKYICVTEKTTTTYWLVCFKNRRQKAHLDLRLKVLTNEKRGGLKLVSFDWSPCKMSSLRFSKESVQTLILFCERPKNAQRKTLFI
jgi:hypothetical protein